MKKSQKDRVVFSLAGIMVVLGILLLFVPHTDIQSATIIINAGVIMAVVRLIRNWREERHKVLQDERTVKISAYAYSYSWTATFVLVGLLPALTEARFISALDYSKSAGIIMLFMLASYFVAYYFLSKRENI